MGITSTQEKRTEDTTTSEQNHSTRLNFSNQEQRLAHIRAFLAWLPTILHEAPHICWERLPSRVMGYLIRTATKSPDIITITLAIGSAMDAQKTNVLYDSCGQI